jgi:DNA-directed RNA polymerase specialized sigma24 family protein
MTFPTTRWTLLAEATLDGDAAGREALGSLCGAYRRPVLAYLLSRGLPVEEAEDLTHDFFLKLMESRSWKRVDPDRGRFRSFLLGILHHVMGHALRSRQTGKRGGGVAVLSLDFFHENGVEFPVLEPAEASVFDREWALSLVAGAVREVGREFAGQGKAEEFDVLRQFLPGATGPITYEDAAAGLGLSVSALKSAIFRLRQRFRELLRTAVSITVSAPHEVDEELRYLGKLLINAPAAKPRVENGQYRSDAAG